MVSEISPGQVFIGHMTARSKVKPISLPRINFLHLTVSEIQPGQTFSCRPPAHPDTMGENKTPTTLKVCGVKKAFHKNMEVYTDYIIVTKKNHLEYLKYAYSE